MASLRDCAKGGVCGRQTCICATGVWQRSISGGMRAGARSSISEAVCINTTTDGLLSPFAGACRDGCDGDRVLGGGAHCSRRVARVMDALWILHSTWGVVVVDSTQHSTWMLWNAISDELENIPHLGKARHATPPRPPHGESARLPPNTARIVLVRTLTAANWRECTVASAAPLKT